MKSWMKQELEIIVLFPELHYAPKGAPPLEIRAQGKGGTAKIAMCRDLRAAMEDPRIKGKSPKWIFISVGAYGLEPIRFHHFFGFPKSGS